MGRLVVVASLAACLAIGVPLTDRLLIESHPAGWRLMRGAWLFSNAASCWLCDGGGLQYVSTMPLGVELVADGAPCGGCVVGCLLGDRCATY